MSKTKQAQSINASPLRLNVMPARLLRVLALCGLLAACSTINDMRPANIEAQKQADMLQALQLNLFRFGDEYVSRMNEAAVRLQKDSPTQDERLMIQNWKVQQAEAAFLICSGPNAVTNALDMVVLATLSRMVLEDVWVKENFGDRASFMYLAHVDLEEQAWRLANGVITKPQGEQFLSVIAQWRAQHPTVRAIAHIHFSDFAKAVGAPANMEEEKKRGSLFSLIGLDPLSNLDPAVREITQTRQLAERSIFYMQRMPGLVSMEAERMGYLTATMPETKTILGAVDRISLVGSAADRLSTSLPEIIAKEREALIKQLSAEISRQSGPLSEISGDLRLTLQAGTETVKELHATLEALDRLTGKFVDPNAASKPKADEPPGRPFDIREYADTIRELTVSLRELNTLATNLDAAVPVVRTAAQDVTVELDRILNRAFKQLLLLVAVLIVGGFLAALGYRLIVARLNRETA